jgi:hypothetical protein
MGDGKGSGRWREGANEALETRRALRLGNEEA